VVLVDPVAVFKSSAGLVTSQDDFGFDYNPDAAPLSSCSNVDITDRGKIRMRGGYDLWVSALLGSMHSGFATADRLAFVEGDALSVVNKEGIITRLRSVTVGEHMSFIDDMYGRIFYANGYENGFIQNDVAYSWAAPRPRVGPNTNKQYSTPPVGHLLGRMGGRTVVAHDNFLYLSEPFNPFSYNLNEGVVPLDSPARMIKEVTGGVWVSSSTAIYYFATRDPRTLDPIKIYNKPAVRGTDVYLHSSEVMEEILGLGVMVTAEDAILFLTDDGRMINMTDDTIDIPPGSSGTAMIVDGRYITKINTFD
jgi:hypothetical protein